MDDVTHPQLVAALVKSPRSIIESLSERTADLWHGATGVAGECGELLEGLVNTAEFRDSDELEKGRVNVLEEAGDILFYTEQLVQRTGIELDWGNIRQFAGMQHIGPDVMVKYGVEVAIYGSQVLDTVKKAAIYNKELEIVQLDAQLHLMLRWLTTICLMFGISREQALEANIAKLRKRYEGLKYTDKAAQLRADKPMERNFIGKAPEPVRIPMSQAFEEREEKGFDRLRNPPGRPDK